MRRRLSTTCGPVFLLACGAWLLSAQSTDRAVAQEKKSGTLDKSVTAFLTQHCVACHGPEKKKGGLELHVYKDEASLLKDRSRWQLVQHMLAAGEMPPPERPRPKVEELERFNKAVAAVFEKQDRNAKPDPGRVTMRRLNRNEYSNTIRDLIGIDFQPGDELPSDDVGYGFDNIGDVLSLSPVLMERYLAVAESIMARAIIVGDPPAPATRRVAARTLEPAQQNRTKARFRALTEKSTLSAPHDLATKGEYKLRTRLYGKQVGDEPVKAALLVNGKTVKTVDVKANEILPQSIEVKIQRDPGQCRVAVEFLNPYKDPKDPKKERALFIEYIELVGPLEVYPPSHRALLAAKPGPKEAQTREVLERFASKAYRRPVTPDELNRLTKFVHDSEGRKESWEAGIQLAMQAVLCSPKFLFRVELDPRPDSRESHPIDDYQLASRLSYFLWNTLPDEELFQLAAKKQLHANLDAQARRMLKDPKADALVESFAIQWLQLRPLKSHSPDPERFPEFNDKLRAAMLKETELFFREIQRNDRSILELIDADYSFVNERLATHYGIEYPGKKASFGGGFGRKRFGGNETFEKVTFKNGERGGLLTQGSILTVNSNPTRTNPVKRGKWVLEQLLGTPPPPPPPNVPDLPEDDAKELKGTLRQRLEQHRKDPACANCHAKMDPLGLAFETYDAIGRFRTKEGDLPIDPSGMLPGGQAFKGAAELKKILLEKKELFSRCLAEKMLTYALGRGLEYYDKMALDRITAAVAKNDYRYSSLVIGIVQSEPFRLRRGKDQEQ